MHEVDLQDYIMRNFDGNVGYPGNFKLSVYNRKRIIAEVTPELLKPIAAPVPNIYKQVGM